jgi:hypothetical protein
MRPGLLTLAALLVSACHPPLNADPAKAVLVTADLPRFWAAFDQGTDAATLQARYLSPGTPELQRFLRSRIGSAERLSETVTRNRAYYASIRANTLSVATPSFEERLKAAFTKAKALDDGAVFPPTALLIGRMNAGGTTANDAILIGLELFTAAPDSPRDTFSDFEQAATKSATDLLVPLIAHEHVHVMQEVNGFPFGKTLAEQCVAEGMADFIGEKTSGQLLGEPMYAWARAREAALWAEFKAEQDGTDISRWLYNQGKDPNRPGDLGYFIGYRIAQAYAKRVGDDAKAVQQLVRAKNLKQLIIDSGYDGTPP